MYFVEHNEWKPFVPMNIAKCAFSACVVNKRFIYTFGGYDGQKRLNAIERYDIPGETWELLGLKLRFPLSNCACFSPYTNKVVVFGGGFSSGFSPHVEMIDVETGEWKSLPEMKEGRDLRNKVVYVDGQAYAIGGLNKKSERFVLAKNTWHTLQDYPLEDNLDSWSSALMYLPNTTYVDMEPDDEEEKKGDDEGPAAPAGRAPKKKQSERTKGKGDEIVLDSSLISASEDELP